MATGWSAWYLRLYRAAHRARGARRERLRDVLLMQQRTNYAASRYAHGPLSLRELDLHTDLPRIGRV
jgi:hypothetical protein